MVPDAGAGFALRNGSAATLLASRVLQLCIFLGVVIWATFFLGGFAFSPSDPDATTGANDTSKIFNFHPVLMALAYIV